MKIAVIIDTWFPFIGGGQISAYEISKRIAKKNIYIDVITRNNGIDDLPKQSNLKVIKFGKISNVNSSISKISFTIKALLFILKNDYDLIHAHAFLPGIVASSLNIIFKKPAILTVHGTSLGTKLNNPLVQFIENIILTKLPYSAEITVSRDFLKFDNINKRIEYIPNAPDPTFFRGINIKKNSNTTVLFIGRLHPQKNLLNLLIAFKNVVMVNPKIKLQIVGSGPQLSKIKEEIKRLTLNKNVNIFFEKNKIELLRIYKQSHILILPSIYEGLPTVLLEAWATKLPVIVSSRGESKYLVKNNVNGYLINNPEDPKSIERVILNAVKSTNLEKMGINGYNLVKSEFSWEKSASDTLSLYEEVIKTAN